MAENDPLSGTLVANQTDPSVVQGLLADPRFQKLNSSQKRQLLSEADPVFADPETFNDAAIEQFSSTKPHQQSVDEAMARGLQKNKGAGKFPEPNALVSGIEALAEGAFETVGAGTPEAINARTGANINEPTSAKFRSPKLYALGESLGAFVPLGEISKTASLAKEGLKKAIKVGAEKGATELAKQQAKEAAKKQFNQLVKESMRMGGVYGVAGGVASEAKEETPEISDAAAKGIISGVIGTALGGAAPYLVKGGSNLTQKIESLAKERIDEFNRAMQESTDKAINKDKAIGEFKDKLSSEISQLVLSENKATRRLAGEEEELNQMQFLSQEELAKLQQEAQARHREARTVILENQPKIEERQAAVESAAGVPEQITGGLPAAPEPSELGGAVVGGGWRERAIAQKGVRDKYDAVTASLPEVAPVVETPNVPTVIEKFTEEQKQGKKLAPVVTETMSRLTELRNKSTGAVTAGVKKLYENARKTGNKVQIEALETQYPELKGGGIGYTWKNLQMNFQNLNADIETANNSGDFATARILKEIKKAVNDDMQVYADQVGGKTKTLFQEANAANVAKEEKFGTERVEKFFTEKATAKPSSVVNDIVATQNVETVKNLKEILNPQEFSLIQASYADRLFSPRKGVAFDPSHFVSQYDNHSDEVLKAVFGEEGFKGLKGLYESHRGAESIKEMNDAINRVGRIADEAERAFQGAKTPADNRRIKADIVSRTKEEISEIQKQIAYLKGSDKSKENTSHIEHLERAAKEAWDDVEKKKNPLGTSALKKLGVSAAILGTAYYSNHTDVGLMLALANQVGSERFGKAFVSPKSLALLERATSVRLTPEQRQLAVEQLSRTIMESGLVQTKNQPMDSSEKGLSEAMQKTLDEQAAKTVPK